MLKYTGKIFLHFHNTSCIRQMVRDNRGALALHAIPMTTTMAAGSWVVVKVATAAVERSAVQDAADAVAVGAAATLAVGMNLLALVNTLMAFLLVIIVALRMLEILLVAATVLFAIAAFIPGLQGSASLSTQAANHATRVFNQESRVAPRIVKALNFATTSERMIARAFPYISSAISLVMARPKPGRSGFGIAGNFSLVPTLVDRGLRDGSSALTSSIRIPGSQAPIELGFPARMGAANADSDASAPLRNKLTSLAKLRPADVVGSLPVEEEGYAQICSRAAADWTNFPGIRDIPFFDQLGKVGELIGANAPGLLCVPIGDAVQSLSDSLTQASDDALSKRSEEEARKKCSAAGAKGQLAKHPRPANQDPSINIEKCTKAQKDKWKNSPEGKEFSAKQKTERTEKLEQFKKNVSIQDVQTAKLWSLISGDAATLKPDSSIDELKPHLFMSAYSVYDSSDRSTPDSKHVHQLTHTSDTSSPVSGFQLNHGTAQARIYFACGEEDWLRRKNEAHGIRTCPENALWRPGGWHWTLTAQRTLAEDGAATGKQILSGYIGWLAGSVAQQTLGQILTNSNLGGRVASAAGRLGGQNGPLSTLSGLFQPRIGSGNRSNTAGQSHAFDWWLGGATGDAVGAALEGKAPESLSPYFH